MSLHLTSIADADQDAEDTKWRAGKLTRDQLIVLYRAAYEAALSFGHWLPANALRLRLKALER